MIDFSANFCYYSWSPISPGANGDTMFLLIVSVFGCGDDNGTPEINYATIELEQEDVELIRNRIDAEGKICTTGTYLGLPKEYCFYSNEYINEWRPQGYAFANHHSGSYFLEACIKGACGWSDLDHDLTPQSFIASADDKCQYKVIMTEYCREKSRITVNAALLAFGARPIEGPEQ